MDVIATQLGLTPEGQSDAYEKHFKSEHRF